MGGETVPGARRDKSKTFDDLSNSGKPWCARSDTELHATQKKGLMMLNAVHSDERWPVYKGSSFNIWTPDTGQYYAVAEPEKALEYILGKRKKAGTSRRDSPHREFSKEYLEDEATLPPLKPRIAFRDITSTSASRTIICCLVPPKIFLANQAPYFLWPYGDEKDQAYLLGVLCSIPLDWYARFLVETHASFFIMNSLPIPRPSRKSRLWSRTVKLAGRLASQDERFSEWAAKVGVDAVKLSNNARSEMMNELDAVVAHLYKLEKSELIHILDTFYKSEKNLSGVESTLKFYDEWKDAARSDCH